MHHVQTASNYPSAGQVTIGFLVLAGLMGVVIWALRQDKIRRLRLWLILFGGIVVAALAGSLIAGLINGLVTPGSSAAVRLIAAFVAMAVAVFCICDFVRVVHPRPTREGEGDGGHRVFHSVMAAVSPSVFLAVVGFWAVALGAGTSVITQFSTYVTALF